MKKLPTLHILNGDASVPAFKVADLPGQHLVWREIMASGPAVDSMPPDAFWQMRQRYITETFQTTTAQDYQEKVLNELPKLENASHFLEVVLWFDSDLVCQINLLYLLHQLTKKRPALISVCIASGEAIAYKKHEQMQQLFEHRQMLDEAQLAQASSLWQLYAGPDPMKLQTYLQQNEVYSEQLKQALTLHLQRFPDQHTFLGQPQKILLTALEDGADTLIDVQKYFWQHDPGYGFGDWQLEALLEEISPELVEKKGIKLILTEKGKQVLTGKAKFEKIVSYWLGGVQMQQQKPGWLYNAETGLLNISEA